MKAPAWQVSEWLNTSAPVELEAQRGHVVVACAFQMLCPGGLAQAIPQMKAVHELFAPQGVVAVGLHTVFEHHEAMTVEALRAFVHEYRIRFPVGVDAMSEHGDRLAQIMRRYGMQGAPTLLLIDKSTRRGSPSKKSAMTPTKNASLTSSRPRAANTKPRRPHSPKHRISWARPGSRSQNSPSSAKRHKPNGASPISMRPRFKTTSPRGSARPASSKSAWPPSVEISSASRSRAMRATRHWNAPKK